MHLDKKPVAKILIVVSALLVISGCVIDRAGSNKRYGVARVPQFTDKQGTVTFSHFDNTQRQTLTYVGKDSVKILAEVEPRMTITNATSISPDLSNGKLEFKIDLSKSQNAVSLSGGGSISEGLAKTFLYRLNEGYLNGATSDTNWKNIFNHVVDKVTETAINEIAHHSDTTADTTSTQKDSTKAGLKDTDFDCEKEFIRIKLAFEKLNSRDLKIHALIDTAIHLATKAMGINQVDCARKMLEKALEKSPNDQISDKLNSILANINKHADKLKTGDAKSLKEVGTLIRSYYSSASGISSQVKEAAQHLITRAEK